MYNDLLKLSDLTKDDITDILNLAMQLKYEQKNGIAHRHLAGQTLGMIFQKASTRTRVSFETGMYQLGGMALFLSSKDLQIGRGEDVEDTARVLSRYIDAIMIRTFEQKEVEDLAKYASIPIINGLTDYAHPCQVLADLLTIREYKGKKMSYELLVSENDEALAELLKAYYGAAGIELTVKAADDNTVKQLIQEGNFTLCANGHGSFGGDPKYMANLATKTAGAAKITVQGGNRWKSDEYDKTMAASLSELDQTKRTELVHKLQEIIATEVPTIPLYYKNNASAFNNSVLDGFFYTPDGISNGIPYIYNKLVLVQGEWKAN